MLRTVIATRYVTPLREGGSVPALVEADDDGLYVVKLLGAGHGRKALVAELLAGELARHLGLPVPDLVLVELDAALAKAEPDGEIQDLLERSAGTNVGLDFLPGALAFAPAIGPAPEPELAAAVVWLDAFTTNVDRTARNPNLLVWHRRLHLIDHGSALYIHHSWKDPLSMLGGHSSRSGTTSCCPSPGRSRRRTPGSRRSSTAHSWSGSRPPSRTTGCRPRTACRTPTRTAGRTWTTSPRACGPATRSWRRPTVPESPDIAGPQPVRVRDRPGRPPRRARRGLQRGHRADVPAATLPRRQAELDEPLLVAMAPDCDPEIVREHLAAIEAIAAGDPDAGPIAALSAPERFHWLVSPSSTIIGTSEVHTGLTADPAATLEHLFRTLVRR